MFVDAACTLPVFIISICLLLSVINQAGAEETAFQTMARRAKAQTDVIAASSLDIETDVLLQLSRPGNDVTLRLIYRPFVGESKSIADSDDSQVYVFPKRGIRYHVLGCSTLVNGDREVILTNAVRRSYSACRICRRSAWTAGRQSSILTRSSTAGYMTARPQALICAMPDVRICRR